MIIMILIVIMVIIIIILIVTKKNFDFCWKKFGKYFFAPIARSKHDSASVENRGSRNADFSEI